MTDLTSEQIQHILDGAPEGVELRHKQTSRNRVLNAAVRKLSKIINNHDPEIDLPIASCVWDCLDVMSSELETPLFRTILAQQQEIERLKSNLDSKTEIANQLKDELTKAFDKQSEVAARAVEELKSELLASTKSIFHPHLMGVFAVIENRRANQPEEQGDD